MPSGMYVHGLNNVVDWWDVSNLSISISKVPDVRILTFHFRYRSLHLSISFFVRDFSHEVFLVVFCSASLRVSFLFSICFLDLIAFDF